MKPAAFDYVRVDTLEEACDLLAEHGEQARVLAGGQSLMPMLNMRLAQPGILVDISRCAPLAYARVENGNLAVGAAQTQAEVEWRATLAEEVPLLSQAFPHISHFQIRNRGTVCGSLAHADPSAELPLCLTALGGEVVLRSKRGRRVLAPERFFHGMLSTARAADELLEEARFPLQAPRTGYAFEEFSMRHGDYAIVAVAAVVGERQIRLAVSGVADRPTLAVWSRLSGDALDAALNDLAWSLAARDDQHASARYRRHLVRQLGLRAVLGATRDADARTGQIA
jgi:2-furoyl-CoA dehydrogenase FAD binding subunit